MEFYLDADKDCANLPQGWKKTANLNLALINQINDRMTIRKGIFYTMVFRNFKFMYTVS